MVGVWLTVLVLVVVVGFAILLYSRQRRPPEPPDGTSRDDEALDFVEALEPEPGNEA